MISLTKTMRKSSQTRHRTATVRPSQTALRTTGARFGSKAVLFVATMTLVQAACPSCGRSKIFGTQKQCDQGQCLPHLTKSKNGFTMNCMPNTKTHMEQGLFSPCATGGVEKYGDLANGLYYEQGLFNHKSWYQNTNGAKIFFEIHPTQQ